MKKLSILLVAVLSVALYSCKDNQKTVEPEIVEVDTSAEEVEVYAIKEGNAEFNNPDIAAVFNQYIQLQNALINTNAEDAAVEAKKLHQILGDSEVRSEERRVGKEGKSVWSAYA